MKSKKDLILETALELFAEKGFSATSTSKIAKEAGVSEGLIFRHFSNKDGLLKSILNLGKERSLTLFDGVAEKEQPLEKLKYILQIPFKIPENEYPFWKLLYAIKWQSDKYDEEISHQLKSVVIEIFSQLEYVKPELEAEFVMMLFDGMATAVLLKNNKESTAIENLILEKYNITP
ncbi:MAG: AcrR family transcriptional regulator [Vicingaceae bacterium]|jgi:AcrR family transcriptional regulator